MNLLETIKKRIEDKIENASIQILDPRNDGCHLEAIVVSEAFEGLTLVERHQMVMDAVKDLFSSQLHALSIKTKTPGQI
ncbi:MAG: BolA family protein [Chlamydiota bacterium]|jgi:stress-induced morphogen